MSENPTNWLIPAIIVATALILMPIIWVVLSLAIAEDEVEGTTTVDSRARIDVELLRGQVESLSTKIDDLQSQIAGLQRLGTTSASQGTPAETTRGEISQLESYTQVVLIANRTGVNKGLKVAGGKYLQEKLGRPREVLSDKCEPMTNESLRSKLVTEKVGPIRVTMLRPAIESLKRVFANVEKVDPFLYDQINTAGALCVRRIRGTTNSLSTHSYGLAVDLNIDGRLDNFTDGKTQLGLTILADFFHEEGWVWGAGFRREDSMHFEISRKKLDEWLAEGKL